jgi:ubiquinone/menaquinone biosynthesis C-methylase UbiE
MTGPVPGNRDDAVIAAFGEEWESFDQTAVSAAEREQIFAQYFVNFPWDGLPEGAVGADLGAGSGRWAACVAPRVGQMHDVEPSDAANSDAVTAIAGQPNVSFHHASVEEVELPAASLDFAYSLGVLHHVPDTQLALRSCAALLKPGGAFLVYLYYAFDNKPGWYARLWQITDAVRRLLARAPFGVRRQVSGVLALVLYYPLSRLARCLELAGRNVDDFPLSYYRRRSLYIMRNDALDRFGTRLEQRFTRSQVETMLRVAGFEDIRFNETAPFWTAVARRGDLPEQ